MPEHTPQRENYYSPDALNDDTTPPVAPTQEDKLKWTPEDLLYFGAKNPAVLGRAVLDSAKQDRLEIAIIDKTQQIIKDSRHTKLYKDVQTEEDALGFLGEVFGPDKSQLVREEYQRRVTEEREQQMTAYGEIRFPGQVTPLYCMV